MRIRSLLYSKTFVKLREPIFGYTYCSYLYLRCIFWREMETFDEKLFEVRLSMSLEIASAKCFGHKNVLWSYVNFMSFSLWLFNYVSHQRTKIRLLWRNYDFKRCRIIFKKWQQFRQPTLYRLQEKILHFIITETLRMLISEYFYEFTLIHNLVTFRCGSHAGDSSICGEVREVKVKRISRMQETWQP